MTPQTAIVRRIIEADGPLTIREIARLTRFSRRDVESAVQALRFDGDPIIDEGVRGLRYTEDPDELRAYIAGRRDRARTILAAAKPLRETERRLRQRDMVLFSELAR